MDHKKLITVVSQCTPLWDRSHDKFRDQSFKATLWNKIGGELQSTGPACREAFKALREKYIREREKLQHYGSNYRTWELLEYLQFLNPYIITRKSSNTWAPQSDPFSSSIKPDPTVEPADTDEKMVEDSDNGNTTGADATAYDFCKALIKYVRESEALWDRHSRDYHDKQLKDRLWNSIAQMVKADVNTCTLRWKGLREKYIRQKQKYSEGLAGKWEFLDDLSFLDNVIQYRKKHWQVEDTSQMFTTSDNSCNLSQANSDYEALDEQTNDSTPNQPSSSTHTYQQRNQSTTPFLNVTIKSHTPDSTLDTSRKRTVSDIEEVTNSKAREKTDGQERTPEQIFGELVAAMLATKSDGDKNLAMIEIMSILAKPSS